MKNTVYRAPFKPAFAELGIPAKIILTMGCIIKYCYMCNLHSIPPESDRLDHLTIDDKWSSVKLRLENFQFFFSVSIWSRILNMSPSQDTLGMEGIFVLCASKLSEYSKK